MSNAVLNAQNFFDEGSVSLSTLKSVLDNAYIANQVDPDGDLYVADGIAFPVWIRVDVDRKTLLIHTYVGSQEGGLIFDDSAAAEAVNELNSTLAFAQFHADKQTLLANEWLSFEGGLVAPAFVRSLQRFASSFAEASRSETAARILQPNQARALN